MRCEAPSGLSPGYTLHLPSGRSDEPQDSAGGTGQTIPESCADGPFAVAEAGHVLRSSDTKTCEEGLRRVNARTRVLRFSQDGITASPPRRQERQGNYGSALASCPQRSCAKALPAWGRQASPAGQDREQETRRGEWPGPERRLNGPPGDSLSRSFIACPLRTPSILLTTVRPLRGLPAFPPVP